MKTLQSMPLIFPVACHTDNVRPGSIFVVIAGMKDDGLRHVALAIEKGTVEIVVERHRIIPEEILALCAVNKVSITRC